MNASARLSGDGREPGDERRLTRRAVLTHAGALSAGTAGLTALTGRSRASHAPAAPGWIDDPVFESSLLESYKPKLLLHDERDRENGVEPSGIHGFVVRSDERDTTALVYWTEYPVQIGCAGPFSDYVSHIGDHEPITILLANEGTTDERIDTAIYSAYHWMAGRTRSPDLDGDGRPRFYVYPCYHHYSAERAATSSLAGSDVDLKDLTSSLPSWLNDPDFHDALSERDGGPAYNPWIMLTKPSWWRNENLTDVEQAVLPWLARANAFGGRGVDL